MKKGAIRFQERSRPKVEEFYWNCRLKTGVVLLPDRTGVYRAAGFVSMGIMGQGSIESSRSRFVGTGDLLFAGVLVAAAALIMRDSWRDTLRIARTDEECSYVLLAPVLIALLAWVRRGRLFECRLRGQWAGLAVLAAGWLIWWYGYLTDPVIWRAGAVVIAVGSFMAAVGLEASLTLAPALAACVFLIPVDPTGRYHVAAPLGTATAFATQRTCELLGMNVDRAGNLLSINHVDVNIAEACNGMRMVLTLFMVCYVAAFTMPLKARVRFLFLAASPLVAVVSNVIRLVPTVWVFGHASKETGERFHDIGGWVMTVIAFVVLMGFAKLMQGDEKESSGIDEDGTAASPRLQGAGT